MRTNVRKMILLCVVTIVCLSVRGLQGESPKPIPENLTKERLVAWCIVPFDAKQRGPTERAKMLTTLGLKRVAYDWRAEHVPQFEEEIQQYKKHDLEFFAFWSWHESLEPLIKKYDIHPQIWITNPSPAAETQADRVAATVAQLLPIAIKTKELGCSLGLYNHGGWGGEPENLVAVCQSLRAKVQSEHVGIVYNFHHGHSHIADFANSLKQMQPYLLCLNLNGMAAPEAVSGNVNKILPIGDGLQETQMIQSIIASGYAGPIGILDHRSELDAQESLQLNLNGLQKVLQSIK